MLLILEVDSQRNESLGSQRYLIWMLKPSATVFWSLLAAAGRLNLTTGPLRYSYFHQCLEDGICDHWDVIATGNAQTVIGFQASLEPFLPYFLRPTDYADQVNYLNNAPMPFKLTCLQLAVRLQFMNRMIGLFPRAPQGPPLTDADIKHIYYRMMLPEWQRSLIWRGRDINDANYTLMELARHMQELEDDDCKQRARHSRSSTSSQGSGRRSPCGGHRRGQGGCGSPDSHRRRPLASEYQAGPPGQCAHVAYPAGHAPYQGFRGGFRAPGQCGGYNPHWRYDQAQLTMREYVRSPANPYVTPSPCSTGHGRGCGCDAFHATDVPPDLSLAPSGPAPVAPSTAPQDLHYAEGEETDVPQHPPTEYDETHWNDKFHLMEAPFEADFPEDEYYDY